MTLIMQYFILLLIFIAIGCAGTHEKQINSQKEKMVDTKDKSFSTTKNVSTILPINKDIKDDMNKNNVIVDVKTINLKMSLIPSRDFTNGEITHSFYISITEVTQAQYKTIMGENPSSYQDGKNGAPVDTSNYPVDKVSYEKAKGFCERLTDIEHKNKNLPPDEEFRLPNATEWVYACSDNPKKAWFFGEDVNLLKKFAWYKDNSGSHTHEVAKLLPNKYGLYDIHGNVKEWTTRMAGSLETYIPCYGGSVTEEPRETYTLSHSITPGIPQTNIGFRIIRIKKGSIN